MSSTNKTAGQGKALPGAGGVDRALENQLLSNYLYYTLAAVSFVFIVWRAATAANRYFRLVTSLNNETQRYFARQSPRVAWLKKHIIYAPLFGKRHGREFELRGSSGSELHLGMLPTRMQTLFILGYFVTNVVFCVIDIPFADSGASALSLLRNRSGTLAIVNLIPLFLFATRNNPLIWLLGISFDTYNLIHRWFGRIVVIESVVHTVAFLANNASKTSWASAFKTSVTVPYLRDGFIATCSLIVLLVLAVRTLRHRFYETFKVLHVLLALVAVVGLWYHLELKHFTQIIYMYPVLAIWGLEHVGRVSRVAYYQLGSGASRTIVEALPSNACRVTVTMARPWTFRPGQHAYLYMPSISYWQSHPFSIAWNQKADEAHRDSLPSHRYDDLAVTKSEVSFIIRARAGYTDRLFQKASTSPNGRFVTKCLVEGPYGGLHGLGSYGTVMLFAGGVGVTQAVPYIRELVDGYSKGTVAVRKVVFVWIIQSPEHLEWIRPWMTEILAMERRREVLRIMLFVSQPRSTKQIQSPSSTVQMFPGRPNIDHLIGSEMENQIGAMGVSVCGPGSLHDDVRQVVRARQGQGCVDFYEESFSW
ncbi:hypothetical protein VTK73DRAFT_1937 [Phialemonium thermophilum]|uniref:ferric-chelate reductase (NADPH) n=1 Tax=Phialemonium thermophilum TaxID=223376 RepID=A0ABR3X6Z8_9PEZI